MAQLAPRLPSSDEQAAARKVLKVLHERTSSADGLVLATTGAPAPEWIPVPPGAADLIVALLEELAAGNAVSIVPISAELTTNQAAKILNVSRPYLVKLLEEKKIPFKMVGTHRRIRAKDLFEYKRRDDQERERIADELAEQGQLLGMGY